MTGAGCGIPCLRCPQSGPATPEHYNWNNGVPFAYPVPERPERLVPPEPIDPPAESEAAGGGEVEAVSYDEVGQAGETAGPAGNAASSAQAELASGGSPVLPQPVHVANVAPLENSAQLPKAVFFEDPYLIGLIDQALMGNQELRILAEEIRIANNEVYARSGEYRPFATLGAGAGLEKSGRHTRAGAVEDQLLVQHMSLE